MAVATIHVDMLRSATWRQFQQACFCVVIALSIGCVIYGVETGILHCEHRFVENPADTITRAIGIAHFTIGWLFLFSSRRLRNPPALTRLLAWTLFGVGFCVVFGWFGGDKSPLMLMAFYSFFFFHEVCDEAHLFRHSGELAVDSEGAQRFLHSLTWATSLMLMTGLAAFHIFRGHWMGRSARLHDYPTVWLLVGWTGLWLLAIAASVRTMQNARDAHGSLREAVFLYRPLLAVYAGLSLILLVGSLFGSVGANLVILVHGMTWLVYTHNKLCQRNVQTSGALSWLRNSPTGFLVLHVSVTLLVLVLFALRTHVWQRTGFLCQLLSKTYFPYWSIMHIAMAFWRAK